jgi:predicted RNA binding protein YcfA (HicA-like mRNA interferase family)
MAKLPIVSGAAAVKALQRLGFFVDRQRGSHVVLKKITPPKANAAVSSRCIERLRLALCGAL